MRAIRVSRDIPAGILGMTALKADTEYLLVDQVASQFLGWRRFQADYDRAVAETEKQLETARAADDEEAIERLSIRLASYRDELPDVESKIALGRHTSRDAASLLNLWRCPAELNKKRLLFLNSMGLGDMLLLAPLLRKIKILYPKVHVGVVSHQQYASLMGGIPWIDEVLLSPVSVPEVSTWHYHVNYERLFEDDPRASKMHACSLFGAVVDLPIRPEEMIVNFDPGKPAMPTWFDKVFPIGKPAGERWIGMFLAGSGPHKNWPADYILQLTHGLCLSGYSVFWLGARGDSFAVGHYPGGTHLGGFLRGPLGHLDLCGYFPNLLQLAAFCRDYIDLIVTPDSFGSHLGGALNIPTLALYGPFNPVLLTSHYKSVRALRGKIECSPCHQHGFEMPCFGEDGRRRRWCASLDEIKPEFVYQHVLQMCPRPSAEREEKPIPKDAPSSSVLSAAPAGRGRLTIVRN